MSCLCFPARTGRFPMTKNPCSSAKRLTSHYGVLDQVRLERHVVCRDSLHPEAVQKALRRHQLLKVVWRRPVERIPRVGVDVRHEHGHVPLPQRVEVGLPLREDLPDLLVVLLLCA